jgi:hypothetical protein
MQRTIARVGRVLAFVLGFGVLMLGIGLAGGFFAVNFSWPGILLWSAILFGFGAWVGLVVVSKCDAWFPRYRKWLHSFTFVALGCVVALVIAHPSIENFLWVAGITGAMGYFGEYWVERI